MRKLLIVLCLSLSMVNGFRSDASLRSIHAQDDLTFTGVGYSIELPMGWSGKSNYFIDNLPIELSLFMPSSIPDLPPYVAGEEVLEVTARLGHRIAPGYWLEELTTQPAVAIYNVRYGGEVELASIEELASIFVTDTEIQYASFDPPVATTINGLDAQIVTGTVRGTGALEEFFFSFHATAIQRPSQLTAIIGFSANAISADQQAIFDGIVDSFQFESFPTRELPPVEAEQRFETEVWAFQYPADWTLHSQRELTNIYSAWLVRDGTSEATIQNLIESIELRLMAGESVIQVAMMTPSEYSGDYFEPESFLFAVPAALISMAVYEFQGESWLEFRASSAAYNAAIFATKRGNALVNVVVLAAPGEALDLDAAYAILSSITAKYAI